MDTVGDAYVVVGFLRDVIPDQDGGGENGEDEHCYVPIGPGPGGDSDAGDEDRARAAARAAATAAAVCGDVLAAARAMILALRDYRRRTGSALHCRVGVALGDVVAGVLGHLQPRFVEGRKAEKGGGGSSSALTQQGVRTRWVS
jgi:class 3 adenylate cyclase